MAGVEVQVAGTYNEYVGTVASGTSVTNVAWALGSGDRNYASGALTRVYIPVSAERENRIVEWGLVHADQDGTLKAGAVDNAAVLADDVVETAKIKDGAVTNAKLSITAGEIGGAWTSYTPATTQISLGTGGTAVGYSTKIGKTTLFRAKVTLGTGGSITSAFPTVGLPFASRNLSTVPAGFYNVTINDFGATNYYGQGMIAHNTSSVVMVVTAVGGAYATESGVTTTVPVAMGNQDSFSVSGWYEAA